MTVWTTFGTGALVVAMIWLVSEVGLGLIARTKSGAVEKADKSSMWIIWLTIGPCIFIGKTLGVRAAGFVATGSLIISFAGLALMLIGQAVRWSAIATLGRFFTADVSIQQGHRIVDRGLYGIVRHPSYTGSLMTFFGFGLTFSNIWSVLVLTLPIAAVFLFRIKIEEQALVKHFGEDYVRYRERTKRLIPWVY